MGRRDRFNMGHRDCFPEDDLAFVRWSRNFIFRSKVNAKRWGFSPLEVELMEELFKEAKARLEEYGPEPKAEPHAVDGYTIYWDKKKRFQELMCEFYGIAVDKDGCFDVEELAAKLLSPRDPQFTMQWKEFLMGHVRETASRCNMPPQWVEGIRERLYRPRVEDLPDDDDSDERMRQILMVLYASQ